MIITIGNQKGGTSKTTIAFNLSIMRSRRKRVMAIDLDPQESLTDLFQIRKHEPKPVCLHAISITDDIHKAQQHFDDIIIDAPGQDNKTIFDTLLKSDIFLIPFQASRLDFMALENMNALAAAVKKRNPDLKALAVLTRTPTNPQEKETKRIRFQFDQYDALKLLPCQISERVIYRSSVDSGMAIIECTNKKATTEIQELYKRIF